MENVSVQNLFVFRECLLVALEIGRYDLDALQVERLQRYIQQLATRKTTSPVRIPSNIQADLQQCLQLFKASRTWRWIRQDFQRIVIELERT